MNVTSGQTPHTGSSEPESASASSRLVSELASRIGSLGVELADVAGNLDEVSGRVSNEADQFKELQRAAEHMVAGNREIDRAAKGAQQAASAAGNEIAESRLLIGGAVQRIGELTGAVNHIQERLASFSTLYSASPGRKAVTCQHTIPSIPSRKARIRPGMQPTAAIAACSTIARCRRWLPTPSRFYCKPTDATWVAANSC
jgi:hypothetical protein